MGQFGKKYDKMLSTLYFLNLRKLFMKKYISSAIVASVLFSAPLLANSMQMNANDVVIEEVEQYGFVGITGGFSSELETTSIVGFRLGMQNNVWRTSFTYENNFDDYQSFMVQADRTVVAGLFGGLGRLYAGLSGGWINHDLDSVEQDGYAYGGNIGLMYYISDQVDLSVDYRYLFTTDLCPIDHIQGVSVSLHYFF